MQSLSVHMSLTGPVDSDKGTSGETRLKRAIMKCTGSEAQMWNWFWGLKGVREIRNTIWAREGVDDDF